VVHVDDYPSFIDHFHKVGIHHGLELAKSKEHDFQFEHSLVRDKSCLPFVSFLDSNVIVAPSKVHL
ncbi:hypothetical protein M378DRAFT_33917, partial [Amanita muscaria Koide BX008]